jgi:hypothetical protein
MKDSVGSIENDETQPFFKPVAGSVKIENCYIRKGVIDNEVVGEIDVINLSISGLHLRDQSKSRIIKSKIENFIDLGSAAILSPDVDEEPRASLFMEDSILGTTETSEGILLGSGNSSATLIECSLKKCSIQRNAKIEFIKCNIWQIIEAKNNGKLTLENTTLSTIFLDNNCKLYIYSSPDIFPISTITTQYNCQADILLSYTRIKNFHVWPGDNIPSIDYGPGYEPDRNISRINLTMLNSSIDNLKSFDDAEVYLILQDSKVKEFNFEKYKNEHILITILDLGGEYYIPEPWPEINLDIIIYHKIRIETLVNDRPISAQILVRDQNGEEVLSSKLNNLGFIEFDLLYEQNDENGKISAGEYLIHLTYLGLSQNIKTTGEVNEKQVVKWQDDSPPKFDDVSYDTDFQRTNRGTRIRAIIIDDEVEGIANATIYYQYKTEGSWSSWVAKEMTEVENNTFEFEIKQLPQGAEVRFYIIAHDVLGNRVVSDKYTYSLPETDLMIMYMIVAFLIFIILTVLVFFLLRRRKIKKYIGKVKEGDPRVNYNDKTENN